MKRCVWLVLCTIPLRLVGQEGGHPHFIAEILEGGNEIKLENGFSWHLVAPFSGWRGLWGGESREKLVKNVHTWQVGDEVTLGIWWDRDCACFVSYILANTRTLNDVPVRCCAKQTTFVSHHVEELGWFSIKLEDGSSWDLQGFIPELFWGWNKGDAVILYNSHQHSSYSLLVNCQASTRDGKFVFVKPAQ